jgi:poly(A) polymerase
VSDRPTAENIVRELRTNGYSAYFVGGCVRDLLLGKPAQDFDIATDATPSQVLQIYPRAHRVGAHFGVVLVDGVEVATFRSDSSYSDGRHPDEVRYETNPIQDAKRRDFTVNALFLDPLTGEILDFVDGRADLRNGTIRAIGDPHERFREDHLRMLRAVRFASRFGFTIEPATANAIRELSPRASSIAAERIRDELVRILVEGGARRGFEMLDDLSVLKTILPEVAQMKGVEQPPEFHPEGDVWIHTLIMLEMMQNPTPTLAMGVLLHDVGKPPTFRRTDRIRFDGHVEAGVEIARDILTRLRFSNDDLEQVLLLVANHMKFKDAPRMKASTLKRFMRLPEFDEHLELHRVDCASSHNMLDNYEFVREKREEYGTEQIAPLRLLTGKDLIAAGYSPGPWFSDVLSAAEDAQLEGRISTKEEALALAAAMTPPQVSEPAST